MTSAVIIEPCYELVTCYWYYAAENHLWRYAPLWLWRIARLRKDYAVRSWVLEAIEGLDPIIVAGGGHGSKDVFTGQYGLPIFSKCVDSSLVNRIAFFLSCTTAKELGPDAVQKGCRAYIGWDAPVAFIVSPPPAPRDPASDPYAWPLFDSALTLLGSLLSGKTAEEAVDAYRRRSDFWIRYWSRQGDRGRYVVAYLAYDEQHLKLLGDPSARAPIKFAAPPLAPVSAGLGLVAAALGATGHRSAAIAMGVAAALLTLVK